VYSVIFGRGFVWGGAAVVARFRGFYFDLRALFLLQQGR